MNGKAVLVGIAVCVVAAAVGARSFLGRREPARLYVSSEESGTVAVIDVDNRAVVATIPVGKRPRGIQLSPDRRTVYVALSGSPAAGPPGQDGGSAAKNGDDDDRADRSADGIGAIDVGTGKLVSTLSSGSDPEQLAIAGDGQKLYVANEDAAELSVIDVQKNVIAHSVKVGKEPEGVTLAPDGRTVWVTSESDGKVYVVDTATNAVLAAIEAGKRPRAIAVTRDSARAFVTLENEGAVAFIDAAQKKRTSTVKLAGANVRPMGIVLSPDEKTAYVTTGRGKHVVAIDVVAGNEAWSVEVGERPWGLAISPDGNTIYTANGTSDDVSILDVRQRAVVTRIKVPGRPWGIALRP